MVSFYKTTKGLAVVAAAADFLGKVHCVENVLEKSHHGNFTFHSGGGGTRTEEIQLVHSSPLCMVIHPHAFVCHRFLT